MSCVEMEGFLLSNSTDFNVLKNVSIRDDGNVVSAEILN